MNRAIWLAFLFAVPLKSSADLTLADAYKAAMAKTEQIPIAESQVRASEALTDKARGNFLPALSAGATYQTQDNVIGTTTYRDQSLTKLTLSQSLVAGGRDRANLSASKSDQLAQQYNVADSKNALYVQVTRSFYTLLSTEREIENIKKSIQLTLKRVEELQKRKRIGKSQNIEILASEAQQAVLEAQLVAAVGERRIAKNNFANVTGLDRNTKLSDNTDLPSEVKALESLLTEAETRPDILGLRARLESTDFRILAAKAGYFPILDLTANYYPSRYHFSSTASDWDAMLVLTIPLFNGGIAQASVREAREKKLQAELSLRQQKRVAETEIHNAYNTLLSTIDQIKALEKALTATEQNYREQEKDYRFSLATNLDVLQALNTFHETKRSLDRTRYQALSAAAELKAVANELEK